jgi:hypothetical protein
MRYKNFILLFFVLFAFFASNAQGKKYNVHTIAFYNLENFYDTINDPNTRDDEWVYTKEFFINKQNNIAKVISLLGKAENPNNSPTIIGLAEVENRMVLEALVKNPQIIDKDYGIVHFESPDRRGIDCAFLYQKRHFKPTSFVNIPLLIYDSDTKSPAKKEKKEKKEVETEIDDVAEAVGLKRIYTRDQILMTGLLDGEEMSFIVNHWPSRRGGEKISSNLREMAAALNLKIIDSLQKINPNAKIISMGDLNDGPFNNSLKKVLNAKGDKKEVKKGGIYNPSEVMYKNGSSTLFYRDAGDIFDQIFMTEPLIVDDYSSFRYWKAGIFNPPFMIQTVGPYKGYPLRNNYSLSAGYSDHLPAYIYLIKQMN